MNVLRNQYFNDCDCDAFVSGATKSTIYKTCNSYHLTKISHRTCLYISLMIVCKQMMSSDDT